MKSIHVINCQGGLISLLTLFIAAVVLAGCGGGDGFPGFRNDSAGTLGEIALFTTAPAAVSIAVAASATYSIGGGRAPYTVTSGNTAVATTSVNGTSFSINGVQSGSTAILIVDAVGSSLSTSATIGASSTETAPALFVTAPRAIAIASGASPTYTIGGGTPPYTVSSSDTRLVSASISATSLRITGVATGSAQISVFDAKGATVAISVSVGAISGATALYVTAPSTVALWTQGVSQNISIGGGTPPYAVSTSNDLVAWPQLAGASLVINAGMVTGSAQISVFDSVGAAIVIGVTVKTPLYTSAPAAITIATGSAPSYAIGGGTAPYTVASSNALLVGASVSGGTILSLTGIASGTANVVVTDAYRATQTIAVTVSSVTSTALVATPSSASANVGNVLNFRVSGGSPPYVFAVNNPSLARVDPASVTTSGASFTVTLLDVGNTTIALVDALGQTATIRLEVLVAPTKLALAPSALTIGEDYAASISLSIQNGTGPYTPFTSDLLLSSVSVSGSTLTLGLGTQGSRCINTGTSYDTRTLTLTVLDALGAAATSLVTIQDNGRVSAGC